LSLLVLIIPFPRWHNNCCPWPWAPTTPELYSTPAATAATAAAAAAAAAAAVESGKRYADAFYRHTLSSHACTSITTQFSHTQKTHVHLHPTARAHTDGHTHTHIHTHTHKYTQMRTRLFTHTCTTLYARTYAGCTASPSHPHHPPRSPRPRQGGVQHAPTRGARHQPSTPSPAPAVKPSGMGNATAAGTASPAAAVRSLQPPSYSVEATPV